MDDNEREIAEAVEKARGEEDAVDARNREIVRVLKKSNVDISVIKEATCWTEEQIFACPV